MKTSNSSASRSRPTKSDPLGNALGWFSLGLGLAELLAPKAMSRLIGIRPQRMLMTVLGLREIASGLGILSQSSPRRWLWSRVLGDGMDLALLGKALTSHDSDETRVESAMAAVAGVTVLDVIAARRQSAESGTDPGKVHVIRSIIIQRPPQEVYAFWRQLENLPHFMRNVESVTQTDSVHSHWVVKALGGATIEWDAEIFDDDPNELISWRTVSDATIEHAGTVRFETAPGNRGTIVRVNLMYRHPGGKLAAALASLLGESPEQKVRGDLYRLKQLLETGEVTTTQGQSAGAGQKAPTWVDDPVTTEA